MLTAITSTDLIKRNAIQSNAAAMNRQIVNRTTINIWNRPFTLIVALPKRPFPPHQTHSGGAVTMGNRPSVRASSSFQFHFIRDSMQR